MPPGRDPQAPQHVTSAANVRNEPVEWGCRARQLSGIGGMDMRHYAIFLDMLAPLPMGERDPDSEFMALANELRASLKTAPEQAGRANDWSDS